MLTRYDPETEDITFVNAPPPPSRFLNPVGGGSSGSATKERRELEGYSTSELRQLWRADRLTEEQWKAELVARGQSAQGAADEVARQKNVGVSTAASTRGQLTASEAAAVNALRSNAPATPTLDQRIASGDYGRQGPTPSGAPLEDITGGASSAVGPAGRTVDQVRGTQYLSDAERTWYLQQASGSPAATSNSPATGGGSTAAAPRTSTSSGGGASSGGGSTSAPAASKLLQGAITRDELAGLNATFNGALAALRNPDGSVDTYVRNPDGSYDYRRTDAAPAAPVRKVSPAEQAATSLVNTQQILRGGQPIDAGGGQAQAPQQPSTEVRNYADPANIMGGGSPYNAEVRANYAPPDRWGFGGGISSINTPYMGGSYTYLPGHAAQDIAAAGMVSTGDPQKDLQLGAALNAKRANLLAEYGDPQKVQSIFDNLNVGTDVYSRARAVSATEQAADRAISGERPPPYGTDNLTASMLSQYITPRPEEPGVEYPSPQPFAEGTEMDKPIMAGADPQQVMRTASRGTAAMDTGPRMLSSGNIMRVRDGEQMFRPSTGGSWLNEAQNSMPSWQDYINQFWDGWEVGPGHILRPQQQKLFQDMVEGWQQKNGVAGGGVNFGSDGPLPWEGTYDGRVQTFGFGGTRGPRSIGIGAYATGTETPIMAGAGQSYTPMDTAAPGRPGFVTQEPLAMIGMQTGQMKGLAGEAGPEAISVTPMQQPTPTAFAQLMESLFATKKSGRKPPLRPVGASMMGAA